jgi:hypothetical protein
LSKNTRGSKEFSRLQESLHENKRLKREIASLRKQLARLDLDRHSYVKDIVDEHYATEEQQETTEKMLKRMKEEWKCNSCPVGYLEINLYTRVGETMYFRKCNSCPNRTPSKKYEPDKVEGPIKLITK